MSKFVIWLTTAYYPYQKECGWLVESDDIKEVYNKYKDKLLSVICIDDMPYLNIEVEYEFWGYSQQPPKEVSKKVYKARCGAEAIEMLKDDLPPMLGTITIKNARVVKDDD